MRDLGARRSRLGAALCLALLVATTLPAAVVGLGKKKRAAAKAGAAPPTCPDPGADGTCPPRWPAGDGFLATSLRTLLHSPTGPPRNPLAALVVNSDFFLEYCARTGLARSTVRTLNAVLERAGVPETSRFTADEMVLYLFAAFWTLVAYYALVGKRHGRNRRLLAEALRAAQLQVHELEEKLILAQRQDLLTSSSVTTKARRSGDEVRIFMDGAFDMMHYGHMNAFRLGRSLGTKLIVGVNSDESITLCKGAPLMNDWERLTMVSGCKFVDEVVPGCPYVMNADYVQYVFDKFDVDYVVHGDDPCVVDGKDVYAAAKAAGKYQSIPRTEGVSTTDIVGRMLTLTKDHHMGKDDDASDQQHAGDEHSVHSVITAATAERHQRPLCEQSKFLTTSRMLRQFSAGMVSPELGQRVIYMDGAWDMFHCGHVTALKAAKKRGDYLIVGVHSDALINRVRGANLPLMNLHERVLSVMGCRYVDDVLIDAPHVVTPDMVSSLKIDEVVHGSRSDDVGGGMRRDSSRGNVAELATSAVGSTLNGSATEERGDDAFEDRWSERYRYPRSINIFHVIPSPTAFDLGSITDRIRRNQDAFQAKIARKKAAEGEYYDERYGRRSTDVSSSGGNGNGDGSKTEKGGAKGAQ